MFSIKNFSGLWTVMGLLLVALIFSASKASGTPFEDPLVLTEDAHLTGSSSEFSDRDVILDGVTLTLDGEHLFRNLRLINGAVITHSLEDPLSLIVEGSLQIEEEAAIDASARGGIGSGTTRDGGSYGGAGGGQSFDSTFGDMEQPIDFGRSTNGSSRGGGAIHIRAGKLELDGQISADGRSYRYGGGSGGSIWLEVEELSGDGLISADGGAGGGFNYRGRGGGGGRIAVYYQINEGFDLNSIQALGGLATGSYDGDGGAGSIHFKDVAHNTAVLRFSGSGSEDSLSLATGVVPDGTTLEVINTRVVFDDADGDQGSGLNRHIRVSGEGYLSFRSVPRDRLASRWDTVTLTGGGVVAHSAPDAEQLTSHVGLHWDVGQLSIDEHSAIDVSARGGIGSGTTRDGGSYGGAGGGQSFDSTFGDMEQPIDFGRSTNGSSRGGGAIHIRAGKLELDGQISADGRSYRYGGGSGGSIWLEVEELSGDGLISADGGAGGGFNYRGRGGGGGRIAVYYQINEGFDLNSIQALGGLATGSYDGDGDAGTVYILQNEPAAYIYATDQPALSNAPVSAITVDFSTPMNPDTFDVSDAVVHSDQGGAIYPDAIVSLSESRYTLTFEPPIGEGSHQLTVGPDIFTLGGELMDQNQNGIGGEADDAFIYDFVIDMQPPVAVSVDVDVAPAINPWTSRSFTLSGGREDNTAIWINGEARVDFGMDAWSVDLTLSEGENVLSITAHDAAGNVSEPVAVIVDVDSIAPSILSRFPSDAYTATVPEYISIQFREEGSGLDFSASHFAVHKDDISVHGSLSVEGDQLYFSPDIPFSEGRYTYVVTLTDKYGNQRVSNTYNFTVDYTPPSKPEIDDFPAVTTINVQAFSGSKEPGTRIYVNGIHVGASWNATRWSYDVPLEFGDNHFEIVQRDRAGNESEPVNVTIVYNDQAPGPVAVQLNPEGNGEELYLDWSGYSEYENGNDIAAYHLYLGTVPYDAVDLDGAWDQVPGGTQFARLRGLERDQRYYVAVVAVNTQGLYESGVTPIAATPLDVQPPEDISNLTVQPGETQLQLSWQGSANTMGDLAGYVVSYELGGSQEEVMLEADDQGGPGSYTLTGLAPASAHALRIQALDHSGNRSAGIADPGVTLLPNPAAVEVESVAGQARLSWLPVESGSLVDHYAVYVSEQDFGSIAGMAPRATVPGGGNTQQRMHHAIAGLPEGETTYLAVTTVNLSGGESTDVTTVSVVPEADTEGPDIEQVLYVQQNEVLSLDNTPVLAHSGQLRLKASDPSGVSRIRLIVEGQLDITLTQMSADYYRHDIDIFALEDGEHTLVIEAFDTLDNKTQTSKNFLVSLAPPEPPSITRPTESGTTNRETLTLEGAAAPGTRIRILNNDAVVADDLRVNHRGEFGTLLTLNEGVNDINAQAVYPERSDWSDLSATLSMTLNTDVPDAPTGLSAQSRPHGEINISWREVVSRDSSNPVTGYNLYRSTSTFATASDPGVEKVNTQPIASTQTTDLVVVDGEYIYAVSAINEAGNEGPLSDPVSAKADSQGPKITQLTYSPSGEYDPISGRIAPGSVSVEALFDQPLRNDPYLAIVPEGGAPITVDLRRSGDRTRYTGQFSISETTPSGTAYAVMSAYDEVGNRGTEILEGVTLEIDTDGPEVTELTLSPGNPLKVDELEGLRVSVALRVDDLVQPGTQPQLIPLLDQEPLAGYEGGVELHEDTPPGEGRPRWLGTFDLPTSAGLDANGEPTVSQLTFSYAAYDDLNNLGSRIHANNLFQVYQGDLPPLPVPDDLSAQAKPEGRVQLSWRAVEGAHAYILYRQSPEADQLTELHSVEETEWQDDTEVDGTYRYAVASIRRSNQQESVSAYGEAVSVDTRRIAPRAPEALTLEVNGGGILAQWDEPTEDQQGNTLAGQALTYNLYRLALAEGDQVTETVGLTPIQTAIPEPIALDAEPSESEYSYFVTALDAAGNESAPSETGYLNVELLPVRNLQIRLHAGERPKLSWRHDGQAISHYRVYRNRGEGAAPVLLTEQPLNHNGAETQYVDESYVSERHATSDTGYTVVAVDQYGAESVGSRIVLPAISLALEDADAVLSRGVMNRVFFRVDNAGGKAVEGLHLYVTLDDGDQERVHQSERFSVEAGAFARVPVVLGGYGGLDGIADVDLRLEQKPQANSKVALHTARSLMVSDRVLPIDLSTEDFVRGGSGKAHFTLENTSDVEAEIILADNNGSRASPEVRLVLEDLDGNVLSAQAIQQYSGDVITLPNRQTVARVAPGETFVSAPVEVSVPAAAPDRVRLRLVIDQFHYHSGRGTHVAIEGSGSRTSVSLEDTPYYAEVSEITPDVLYGQGQVATVEGRAINRSSGSPQAGVPVRLLFNVRGFERGVTVYTDSQGQFNHEYRSDSTYGIYRVSAVHPDVSDRPDHGQIHVVGAGVSPRELDVQIPRNYAQAIPIRITAGHESDLTNIRLTAVSPDGDSLPQLPIGVNVDYNSIGQIKARDTGQIIINFTGDNSANRTGSLKYRVEADNFTGENALGSVRLDYSLSEARPALSAKPTFIDTGLGLEDELAKTLVLENSGLETLYNASVELVDAQGNPAPNWVRLLTNAELGDIPVGGTRSLQLHIEPGEQTDEGNHEFELRASGDNLSGFSLPVFIAVTQSGVGNAFFHVSDIYTATLDDNNQPIPGLSGARIELQNEQVLTETYTLTTNDLGEALFEDIPAGRYHFRATAFDHQSNSGRVWVRPGVTTAESVFLANSLITVEWSVREISVEDRYEIKLEATFEANVPAAVVVFDPLSIRLPVMERGDTFQGELTLTNYGLIRATNVSQTLPASNDLASFEFLREVPDTLEAGEVFRLPYRIRALRDFNPEADPMATGGGCGSFNSVTRVNYESECVNGETINGSSSAMWYSNWGRCGSSSVSNASKRDIEAYRDRSQPRNRGYWLYPTGEGLGDGIEPLWCKLVTECEQDNCENMSAK